MTVKIIVPVIPPSMNKFSGRENVWEYRLCRENEGRSNKRPILSDLRDTGATAQFARSTDHD